MRAALTLVRVVKASQHKVNTDPCVHSWRKIDHVLENIPQGLLFWEPGDFSSKWKQRVGGRKQAPVCGGKLYRDTQMRYTVFHCWHEMYAKLFLRCSSSDPHTHRQCETPQHAYISLEIALESINSVWHTLSQDILDVFSPSEAIFLELDLRSTVCRCHIHINVPRGILVQSMHIFNISFCKAVE